MTGKDIKISRLRMNLYLKMNAVKSIEGLQSGE